MSVKPALKVVSKAPANLLVLFFIIRWQIWHWHKACAFADLQANCRQNNRDDNLQGLFPKPWPCLEKNILTVTSPQVYRYWSWGFTRQGAMFDMLYLDSKVCWNKTCPNNCPHETLRYKYPKGATTPSRSSWNNALTALGLPAPSFTASFPAACRTAEITGGCSRVDGPLLETWTRKTSVIMCDSVWFMEKIDGVKLRNKVYWLYCPFLSTRPSLK